MGKCTAFPFVETKDGMKRSKFFEDLLHHGRTREEAKEDYFVGTNEEFLEAVGEIAEFDENGEITYESYNNLVGVDTAEDTLIKILEKDARVGTYTYDEAVNRLRQFNEKNPHKEKYMATIEPDGNKYHLKIVENTATNRALLEKTIRNQYIQNSIIERLKGHGVAVDFLEDNTDMAGRFSTANAVRSNDLLYHLIQVSKGAEVLPTLAEEAGHFIVAAMGKDPLVQRLERTLANPTNRDRILGEADKVWGPNPAREAAGVLVGKALKKEILNDNFIDRLTSRIVSKAKRIFAAIPFTKSKYSTARAEDYARQIAQGFLSDSFKGSLDKALEREETYYDARKGTSTRAYQRVIRVLSNSIKELKATTQVSKLSKHLSSVLKESVKDNRWAAAEDPTMFGTKMALDGIITAVSGYLDVLGEDKEIDRMIKSIDLNNDSNFIPRQMEYGDKLNQLSKFLNSAFKVIDCINIELGSTFSDATGVQMLELIRLKDEFNRLINIVSGQVIPLTRDYFARYCEQIYGKEYVQTSRRLVFTKTKYERNPETGRMEKKKNKNLLTIKESDKVFFKDVVAELDSDISAFERLFASMADNSDLVGQINNVTVSNGKVLADKNTNRHWDMLKILDSRWKEMKLGKDQAMLFEKSDDGLYTGNILSDLHWGKWEKARQEEKDKLWKQFTDDLRSRGIALSSMSEIQASLMFEANYLKPGMKEWNKLHSFWDKANNRWMPAKGQVHSDGTARLDYTNPEYDRVMNDPNLSDEQKVELKEWYKDYLNLKWSLDAKLPRGATLPYRMPQFRANFTNKMRNRSNTIGKAAARRGNVREWALETFCATGEDYDFGYLGTINALEQDYYKNLGVVYANEPRRLPIFGINLIQNTNNLSTDLAYSTLCYAAMANSYEQLNTCINALEVGKEAIFNREVDRGKYGRKVEKDWGKKTGKNSGSYRRYIDFLDKSVYGISVNPDLSAWFNTDKVIPEKIVSFLSRMSSMLFLGWNYVGGMVNTGTGQVEIFKESMVGDFINFKSVMKAHQMYFMGDKDALRNPKSRWALGFGSFVENWMDFGKQAKDNKISLFCREFDVDSKNAYKYRDWHATHKGWYNVVKELPLLAYSSGDHYMQSISYIALALETKLYDINGNETDLYHAYKLVDNVDKHGNKKGKTLEFGAYFKDKDAIEEYKLIERIQRKLASANSTLALLGGNNFNTEENDYLNNHNIAIVNLDNAKIKLEDLKSKLLWTDEDKVRFQNKARQLNNRLHGIYDRQNAVGFSNKWWGNALLAMRGWMLGWAQRRFATDHYSLAFDQNVEGTTVTLAKTILYSIGGPSEDLGNLWKRLGRMAVIFGLGGYDLKIPGTRIRVDTKRRMEELGLSDFQQGNIRRNFWDCVIIALLSIIKSLTALPPKEEREKDFEPSLLKGWIYYLTGRLLLEQGAFSWQIPTRAWSEYKQTAHVVPSGVEGGVDVLKMLYEASGLIWADKKNSDIYYQAKKKGKYEKEDPKIIAHLIKYSPLRSLYTIEHPYDAYQSYETFTLNKR